MCSASEMHMCSATVMQQQELHWLKTNDGKANDSRAKNTKDEQQSNTQPERRM